MPNAINYATEYSRALAQAFPYVLNFGKLYATPNNGRYRWVNSKTIEIPSISTTGRVPADRDTIATATRNYDNAWEPKTLTNQRKWSTLVHPADIDQTNLVVSIQNITQAYNEEQKFPEMDAYCASTIYHLWTALGKAPDHTALTTANLFAVFDTLMLNMDNARVPANGRILYCTYEVKKMLKEAQEYTRNFDVQSSGESSLARGVSRIDEVEVIGVPATLMKTEYDFSQGWAVKDGADQINMMLIHPSAVITPVSYQFSQLDEPSAVTEGKYIYYEESFEDVFLLNKKADAIQMNTTVNTSQDNTLKSLTVGGLTLSPAFDGTTVSYTAATTNATNKVAAVANDSDAAVEIKLGGTTKATGTGSAEETVTWASGANALTVDVTTAAGSKTYTVTVTKS